VAAGAIRRHRDPPRDSDRRNRHQQWPSRGPGSTVNLGQLWIRRLRPVARTSATAGWRNSRTAHPSRRQPRLRLGGREAGGGLHAPPAGRRTKALHAHACSLNYGTTSQFRSLPSRRRRLPPCPESLVRQSIAVWPRPGHHRKRTCGAEPVAQLVLAAARYVRLSRPVSVCASTVTCDNTRTCNSTWIVQRMPMSASCVLTYLCADMYVANGCGDLNLAL